jgi:PAS domain S-box-containing protein
MPGTPAYRTVGQSLSLGRAVFGRQTQTGGTFHFWLPLTVLAVIALSPSIAATPTRDVRRILILNEENATYPGISIINQGIQAGLNDSPYQLQLYSEYMDTSLFPDQAIQQELRDAYIRKYQNRKLDVIITVGPSPLKFMQAVHQKAFPGVPIVFCLPTLSATGPPSLDSDFTGVEDDTTPAETVRIALRLVPGTRNVVVVGGVAPIDREVLANVKKELMSYEGRVEISYLTDLAMPDLLQHLRRLPSKTIILLTSIGQDAAGTSFKSNESSPLIIGAANVPVFSLFDVHLNYGEVGGYLSSLREQGKVAGGMALRILNGEKPQDIARVKGANTYMFDWRAIKRWGLMEREIPPGSIVINRQPTIWEAYKHYVIPGIAVIFAETLLIFTLLWQRKRRRESELHLRESEERFRLVANTAPVMIWMSGLDRKPTYFNQLWLDFTGLSETDLRNGLVGIVHPEDRSEGLDIYRRRFDQRQPFRKECRLRRYDGQYRWMLDVGVPRFHKDGYFAGYIGSCIDVTDHKLAEAALSDMTRKLVAAQEKERTRIARELHDDINQRLAMLAVELEQVQNDPSEIQQRVSELRKQTIEISNGVQALSHDLHSSQLEYLGAVAGMKSWCKEFGERQGMEIDCRQDVRSTLPQELGLCLFRVLQEALHNAAKHSGVKRIEVQLHEESDEIHLTIRDLGKGFDVEAAKKGQGLGLTSMQERVRSVNGKIAIESKPMGGTTIHVRVPFSSEKFSQRAVG